MRQRGPRILIQRGFGFQCWWWWFANMITTPHQWYPPPCCIIGRHPLLYHMFDLFHNFSNTVLFVFCVILSIHHHPWYHPRLYHCLPPFVSLFVLMCSCVALHIYEIRYMYVHCVYTCIYNYLHTMYNIRLRPIFVVGCMWHDFDIIAFYTFILMNMSSFVWFLASILVTLSHVHKRCVRSYYVNSCKILRFNVPYTMHVLIIRHIFQ